MWSIINQKVSSVPLADLAIIKIIKTVNGQFILKNHLILSSHSLLSILKAEAVSSIMSKSMMVIQKISQLLDDTVEQPIPELSNHQNQRCLSDSEPIVPLFEQDLKPTGSQTAARISQPQEIRK